MSPRLLAVARAREGVVCTPVSLLSEEATPTPGALSRELAVETNWCGPVLLAK